MIGVITASLVLLEAVAPPSSPPSSPTPSASARPSTTPAATPSLPMSDLAPADEYFGKLRLSVVRMHHQVFALKDDLHRRRQRISAISHEADSIGEAFFDWAHRFPKDRWVPRTGWELATLYEELPGKDAREQAVTLLTFVRDRYAKTSLGSASSKELARGIGVRPWPRWASAPSSDSRSRVAGGPAAHPTYEPQAAPVTDASTLLSAIRTLESNLGAKRKTGDAARKEASNLEEAFRRLSRDGSAQDYSEAAWELGAMYQLLPGEDARTHAIRMLALVLDRYGNTRYAAWSLRDLERGVGIRQ